MMKKLSKIICCLILPILSIFGLTACGSDKSVAAIQNKYSAIKVANPDMFVVAEEGQEETSDAIRISYKEGEMQRLSALTYNNLAIMGFQNDYNSYKRYYALSYVQQQLLTDIYAYYDEQSDNFYENYDIAGVSQDELNVLFDKVEAMANNIKEFKVAKEKLEQTVDVMTFTGVVRADLTAYSYSVNVLIEQSLDLVGYFKDLNTKYFYNGEITEENKVEYVRHYLAEANFELAEVCYYKYLKAFNNVNECDLSGLIFINSGKQAGVIQSYIWDERNAVKGFDRTFATIGNYATQDEIDDFKEIRASFLQKSEIYKTIYDSMDYYNFNIAYLNDELSDYKDEVGVVEKANIKLIELYYETTVIDYIDALKTIKVG